MAKVELTKYVCDVSLAAANGNLSTFQKNYPHAQGFTVGKNNNFVALKIKGGSSDDGCILEYSSSGGRPTKKIKGQRFGHGNDCAYLEGYYYITQGGGGDEQHIIRRYDSSFNADKYYECIGSEGNIKSTGIAHLTEDFFLIFGAAPNDVQGHIFVCKKYDSPNSTSPGRFAAMTKIEISKNNANAVCSGTTGQGIYYDQSEKTLYIIYSGAQTKNVIAKFTLTGPSPSYTAATPGTAYACDNTDSDIKTFEAEAMSEDSKGNKYLLANINLKSNVYSPQECDSIFQVKFIN